MAILKISQILLHILYCTYVQLNDCDWETCTEMTTSDGIRTATKQLFIENDHCSITLMLEILIR